MLGPYAWVGVPFLSAMYHVSLFPNNEQVPPNYWTDPVALSEYGGAVGFSTEISPGGSPLTLDSWLETTAGNGAWCPAEGAYSDTFDFHCGNQHGVFRSLNYFVPPLEGFEIIKFSYICTIT